MYAAQVNVMLIFSSLMQKAICCSQLPFAVDSEKIRFLLTGGSLRTAKNPPLLIPLPSVPFNSQKLVERRVREGDVFINLKDPGERRTVRESNACPGDPGQSEGWIRQHF